MLPRVLAVDPDCEWTRAFHEAVSQVADIDVCASFKTARVRLFATRPALLVANLRLGPYNGLHLVHLAASAAMPTRCVVYGDPPDPGLAREAQATGAFYEPSCHVVFAIPSYLSYLRSTLPAADRRDPTRVDSRGAFRGGHRLTDRICSFCDWRWRTGRYTTCLKGVR